MTPKPKKSPLINKDGNTLLHIAAGHEQTLPLLEEYLLDDQDPNIKNSHGETPLDVAEQYGIIEAKPLLIKYGGKRGSEIPES